ncbi:MAG TPA: (Fe-S)-binding protein [Lachnospiraceae bacterium]|nr:(Fe-S)-binding protein [Lachnospiraceae bacterium]
MKEKKVVPGTGGEHYIPYEERTGGESVVYFTHDLSAEGLVKIYGRIMEVLGGRVAVKLHTGEKNGPNIIPRDWVRTLMEQKLPDGTIIETNSYYEGDRDTTEKHRETLRVNGWTFAPVDIMDADGAVLLPVKGGKWFSEMSMGKTLQEYDSLLALTHFKGHSKGGFGGSDKNIGIGCADGKVGKAMIHTTPGQSDQWDISNEEFMERMTESTKAVVDYFGRKIAYINVMRNMSVSCDCEGIHAEPVVTPNVGICASLDILAVDQACVDIVYAMTEEEHHDLVQLIESRHGLRQLSYMKELGMGNDRYTLVDIDNEDRIVQPAEVVKGLMPFAG